MGAVSSKSPLERRNTIARRSQRRTLHNLKPKIESVLKDIKKFKGITEDVNYTTLKNEIEFLKNDLNRRGKDLQPQVRNLYENIYKKVSEAEEALQRKLEENQGKLEKKEGKLKESLESTSSIVDNYEVRSEPESQIYDNEIVVDIHADQQARQQEAYELQNNQEKRKTVEIKLVKVLSEEDIPKVTKEVRMQTPSEKRKSILKAGGVPVMPGSVMNEFAAQSSRITRQYQTDIPTSTQDVNTRINIIVESLRDIELQINEFIGKKHGKQYNKIRDTLNRYLIELNSFNPADEYAIDQIKICRNYVGSCLSFLDEKTTDDVKRESFASDDEVFENNNLPPMSKIEQNFNMQRLLKNTPV